MTKQVQRVIISGGGTGGHIFPALSIADALRRRFPEVEILFVGADGRMEMTRVPEAGYRIVGLPVEGLQRRKVWLNFRVVLNYLRSLVMARRLIQEFKPEVVIGVGGYASAPTLKAAQTLNVPTLIQEQNSYAGKANRHLAGRVATVCVAYPNMEKTFPRGKLVLTGNPVRPQIEYLSATREEALSYFGFSPETERVVLVVGGSLGARTINESITRHLDAWGASGVALIWQTGKHYIDEAQRQLAGYAGQVYCSAFLDRMDYAYRIADLVISRAGASSISELCLLGKPTILVPSPNVAEDHQTKNALALSIRSAAILIRDGEARAELSPTAIELVRDDARLSTLSTEIKKLAHSQAAERIVNEIVLLADLPKQ